MSAEASTEQAQGYGGNYHSPKGDVKRLIRQKAEAATGRKMSNKAAKKWLKRYRPNFGKIE